MINCYTIYVYTQKRPNNTQKRPTNTQCMYISVDRYRQRYRYRHTDMKVIDTDPP